MVFFLEPFVNDERPVIQDESVQNIPRNILTVEDAERLQQSFQAKNSDIKCAAAARLWEDLLEKYHVPFLLLRVADMRYVTRGPGSQFTALLLYIELGKMIKDPTYTTWLSQLEVSIMQETRNMLFRYKSEQNFTPTQRWLPGTSNDRFPYCRMQKEFVDELQNRWKGIGLGESAVLSKFVTLHCLETNAIEGVFQFDSMATTILVQADYPFKEATLKEIDNSNISSGTLRNLKDALSVLQDTIKAFDCIFEVINTEPVAITPSFICHLHKKMMASSAVMVSNINGNQKIIHLSIGTTREVSCVNVAVTTSFHGRPVRIQFCPYDSVNDELEIFCGRFNELMQKIQKDDMDPFAAAAWISHVFVTIHPFEDGNGRLS